MFLAGLDNPLTDWGVYVNPASHGRSYHWRIGHIHFDHSPYIRVGSYDELSFGRHNREELLLSTLGKRYGSPNGLIYYQGKRVVLNVSRMVELFQDRESGLDYRFRCHIATTMDAIAKEWSLIVASEISNIVNDCYR